MNARRQGKSAWLGTVLIVASAAIYLGCAGANKASAPPPQATADAAPAMPSNPYQSEIVAMMSEIRGWRVDLDLTLEPSERVFGTMASARKARNMCPITEVVEVCRDICTLADHICENAENICRIADEDLPGDAWAADKCSSAKASCKEAGEECCGCQNDNEADAGVAPAGAAPTLPRQPGPEPTP